MRNGQDNLKLEQLIIFNTQFLRFLSVIALINCINGLDKFSCLWPLYTGLVGASKKVFLEEMSPFPIPEYSMLYCL